MTKNQFRWTLEKLELSQSEAARLFGLDARTIRRYVLGTTHVPVGVALLMRLLQQKRVTVEDIEAVQQ